MPDQRLHAEFAGGMSGDVHLASLIQSAHAGVFARLQAVELAARPPRNAGRVVLV